MFALTGTSAMLQRGARNYLDATAGPYLKKAASYVKGRDFPLDNLSWCNLSKTRYKIIKRMMDISFGISGTACLIPIALTIIPLIQAMSWGPVFFSQQREGKDGNSFGLLKFRTMYKDVKPIDLKTQLEHLLSFKPDYDPRVIPTGRPIRKSGLDEWPQFGQILFGQMTMVGPRPKPEAELNLPSLSLPANWRKIRQLLAPGLIPIVLALKGDYASDQEHAELETWYIANWSPFLDVKLIFRSALVLAAGRHK
ncbi:hypothetical protein A2276_01985 [candidate division WOR-1 bacterium RIFOXYA12_FULL_43_27]|uniref:Bacterial sugar transferase domain-containing protein n=1 Tax=candidate division WOR-1 bacterium RIFOXYC2_FULL_46_14 TaxID=1802587 RepID=A0A1F4U6I8_UNCSA|nr:MAG: hypothetical protein A2276_01985 [candidate division WOR-1 bacterium RIFOXYA12_FULL_43_27]OGC19508.1 MAG: hypothetical protein A2292_02345 [candidate division WOR-1 bacterium RIFOXYB2_FULL_46_45]OGC30496.1 MAG: hypothetical protein A2232_02345 [candidate division WOR-1 bacterium RIFOXYA2_FULL_46_56]OGC40564.1 MAG: hypothetical protein A2438_06060 [candidate division WOR-1 bacterium RIFOXYC2_FULL_46_14]